MLLYLVRHAHAMDADEDGARPLSAQGREQIERLAEFLRTGQAMPIDQIWHSPLVRARQTARLLAEGLGRHPALSELPELEPESPPRLLIPRLQEAAEPLAIVGHEPHLSTLASLLVTGKARPVFLVRQSAVLALERMGAGESAFWLMRWHLSPELFGV